LLQTGIVVGSTPLTLNVDVPGTQVSGLFTVGGSTVPPAGATVRLTLRNAAGDSAPIAPGLANYTATVIPGTYDVTYDVNSAESGPSAQQSTKLAGVGPIVVGSTPLTLNVNVAVSTISGTITVNGTQVPSSAGSGRLILQNATAIRPFANTSTGTYSTPIVPGTYDLYYSVVTVGPGVPSNTNVKLRSGVVIGTNATTLDVDIPATTVTSTVTVNGAPLDPSLGTGTLHLRTAAGDDAIVGKTAAPYSQLVVAGSYDLSYALETSGTGVPANQSAKLRTGIVVGSTPLALDIDIAALMVSGTLSQAGIPYPLTGNATANLVLQTASGDKVTLGSTYLGTYARYVIAGTYELMYEFSAGSFGPAVLFNTLGDLGCYSVP
jgi:hypothetical protein